MFYVLAICGRKHIVSGMHSQNTLQNENNTASSNIVSNKKILRRNNLKFVVILNVYYAPVFLQKRLDTKRWLDCTATFLKSVLKINIFRTNSLR